uniref:YdhG-like domain-containing protein n=1 Tax=uncultured marine group II/III euryarchaeote KM3_87_G01 TaxID=1456533 RepID=A0A075HVN9_9EURY|nr:hypothetical protein [uncultured marine group II/III euryarchaeote KM3_87_G01]
MASIQADTVEEYLAKLPENRKDSFLEVRQMIIDNLPDGYVESINWGMLSYEVPLQVYPDTYNGEPLMFCALAAQKRNLSLHMMSVYQDQEQRKLLLDAFEELGVKPNMGKSCLRFTNVAKIPMQTIGQLISDCSMDEFIESYEKSRSSDDSAC